MIRRLVPFPLLALGLFLLWTLLTGFSPGHILLGAAIGLIVSRVMITLAPQPVKIRFRWSMITLAGILIYDIVRSNIAVGRIILFHPPERRSGFIYLPIELESPYALSLLAIMLTATPGTLWLQHYPERKVVLIHVLDLVDEEEWVALIKHRYERLLREIFE